MWVTEITEHPTREGKLYCCVVLEVFSRRVVGWSTWPDSTPDLSGANSTQAPCVDAEHQATDLAVGVPIPRDAHLADRLFNSATQ